MQVTDGLRLYVRLCNDFNDTLLADCPIQDYGNVVARINSSSTQVKCISVAYSDAKTFKDSWNVEFRDRLDEYYSADNSMDLSNPSRLARETSNMNGTAITYTTSVDEKDLTALGI